MHMKLCFAPTLVDDQFELGPMILRLDRRLLHVANGWFADDFDGAAPDVGSTHPPDPPRS